MKKYIATLFAILGVIGIVNAETIEKSKTMKSIDNYVNDRTIPKVIKDQIMKEDLVKITGNDTDRCVRDCIQK